MSRSGSKQVGSPQPAGVGPSRRGRILLGAALVAACAAAAALLSLAGRAAATDAPATQPAKPALKAVVTYSILADMVRNVAGDRVAIITLVGPDGDAHTYQPSPADSRALADANLVFENGLGFETWIDKLYAASGSAARRVVATHGIKPRTLVEDGREERDPHAWQDVANAIVMTRNVAAALIDADPADRGLFTRNADAYVKSLEDLDAYVADQARSLPSERRKLVTSHDSLGYFAQRYGFEISGSALSSVSTEEASPSAKRLAAVIDEVRAAHVPAVFVENMQNPKLMEQIAREANVKVVATLYTDALGPKGSKGETYLKMMRFNIDTIVGALKP